MVTPSSDRRGGGKSSLLQLSRGWNEHGRVGQQRRGCACSEPSLGSSYGPPRSSSMQKHWFADIFSCVGDFTDSAETMFSIFFLISKGSLTYRWS